ncbi:MAG: histidinol-phosphatase HisJ family protein [Clostridiales bacterium]|nr:histidinol-phosphatase HisJ family protein [Clostridiales bacterium]
MYDYHTHTNFSEDGNAPMEIMVESAIKLGLKEMAITDHYDPDYPDPNFFFDLDFDSYHNEMETNAVKYRNKIKIVRAIEIGIQHGSTLDKCKNASNSYDYDFIMGSFHCAEGLDLYNGDFFESRTTEDAYIAFYKYVYNCLNEFNDFDVLGHINVIDRYGEYIPDSSIYVDIITDILSLLISKGKGIEINTSSFRYGMGDHTIPTDEILKIYYKLGGEIITVGSDAHYPQDLGYKLSWAFEKAKSIGFKYIASYDQRKPSFIKIP